MVPIMRSVQLTTLVSIAFAALLSVTVSAATAASEQDGAATTPDAIRFVHGADDAPPRSDSLTSLEGRREDVRDSIVCAPSIASAGEKPLPAGPRRRPFVAVLAAVPLVTYAAATGPRGSEILTPADRVATSQLVDVGYVVNPQFRFGVIGTLQ